MPVDPVYLREHYASLEDEPLLANDRADLVETAQRCSDYEVGRRNLTRVPIKAPMARYVPGGLNLQAASVLDRDIFNTEFEAEWKTHLETLSDDELHTMNPQEAFCGLFDRIERVTRAYAEEIARHRVR